MSEKCRNPHNISLMLPEGDVGPLFPVNHVVLSNAGGGGNSNHTHNAVFGWRLLMRVHMWVMTFQQCQGLLSLVAVPWLDLCMPTSLSHWFLTVTTLMLSMVFVLLRHVHKLRVMVVRFIVLSHCRSLLQRNMFRIDPCRPQ